MFHGGSGGGGGVGRTCMSLPLGKYLRRALRGGGNGGRGKPRLLKDREFARHNSSSSSVELITSSTSSAASASWSMSSSSSPPAVVRVVLWSGLVEVYTGVVLACTVIRRHPPGLCLAHTDVFRNPHRATLRPLEPLFPGQKFFLLPETTVRKLQRNIPLDVRSLPAPFPQAAVAGDEEEEEEASSTAAPERCCAKDYYVNRERWAEAQFKTMVERGLAAASQQSASASRRFRKKMKKTRQLPHQKDLLLLGGGAMPLPMTSRAWEPSLPPVLEEAPPSPEPHTAATSPAQDQAARTDHESSSSSS